MAVARWDRFIRLLEEEVLPGGHHHPALAARPAVHRNPLRANDGVIRDIML